jgi:dimethylargininase
MIAITHVPSPNMDRCELTHVERAPIHYGRACEQHAAYCDMLRECGATVVTLDVYRYLPDCCFVEDTAVVLDEVAVLTPMGTESRHGEPVGIEPEVRRYRDVVRVELPATLEGGDVLHAGRTLLVGETARTNRAGIEALTTVASRYGYRVVPLSLRGCLHLQTAVTALDDRTLLVNPAWLDVEQLRGFKLVRVPAEEPWAANVARVGRILVAAAAFPRTADLLRSRGYEVRTVDVSEFAKAEGGVTCLSLIIDRPRASLQPH